MNTVISTFKLKRGTEARWEELNPILEQGEPGFVYDKYQLKIGDGITPWVDLPFIGETDQTELIEEIISKLETIEIGAEVNVIEQIFLNEVSLPIVDKTVSFFVPTTLNQLEDWDNLDLRLKEQENSILEINKNIPEFLQSLNNKIDSEKVYTKEEIGLLTQGQTITGMINDAAQKNRELIANEELRATEAESIIESRLIKVESFFEAIEKPDETIDTLTEILKYIEEDKTGAIGMLEDISRHEKAITQINDENTGILATAKNYIEGKLMIASETPGLVKSSNFKNQIKVEQDGSMTVNKISTSKLYVEEGDELVLNGGA